MIQADMECKKTRKSMDYTIVDCSHYLFAWISFNLIFRHQFHILNYESERQLAVLFLYDNGL